MIVILLLITIISNSQENCNSKIYCEGDLLKAVQLSGIYSDSKTFVDLKMKYNETTILQNFENLNLTEIKTFVDNNFENKSELATWIPPDFQSHPKFTQKITNHKIQTFAWDVIKLIPKLGRKMKKDVLQENELYSFLPAHNGFIIPGGRFREFYYWDSYWIIKALLLCEMYDTARGMIENFFSLIERYGFVPNGARLYYLNRSQPPLLILMVEEYYKKTQNKRWLSKNLQYLETEMSFFFANLTRTIRINGEEVSLFYYNVDEGTPRPESYREDYQAASNLEQTDKERFYKDIKSAAESGWDFSSRWFIAEDNSNMGNLTQLQTRNIIPVDLNAIQAKNFEILSRFYKDLSNKSRSTFWNRKAQQQREALELFYNSAEKIWQDLNAETGKHRNYFHPSNFLPLTLEVYNTSQTKRISQDAVQYLKRNNIGSYRGGIPTSLDQSGQQWDLPNAWPPLQDIIVLGLKRTRNADAVKLAREFAANWVAANYRGFKDSSTLYEKYDAFKPGQAGGGGEYSVQTGFGWSIGVVLEFINEFYTYNDNDIVKDYF